jgi:hypothetical protein
LILYTSYGRHTKRDINGPKNKKKIDLMTVRVGTDRTETDEALSAATNILLDCGQK